jgi:hypothetical protein
LKKISTTGSKDLIEVGKIEVLMLPHITKIATARVAFLCRLALDIRNYFITHPTDANLNPALISSQP